MSQFFYSFSRILFCCSFLFLASCSGFTNVNQRFEDQYGMQIEGMRMAREAAKFNASQADIAATNMAVAKNNQDWRDDFAANRAVSPNPNSSLIDSAFYAYEDRSAVNFNRNNETFMPKGGETYGMSRKPTDSLPEDMFVVTYNTIPHPPFIRIGDDFDSIEIPASDAYQVKTEPTNKPYLLVDASSVQKSVDQINQARNNKDITESENLIKDMKQLKREKTMLVLHEEKPTKNKTAKKSKNEVKNEVVVYNVANDAVTKQNNSIFDSFRNKSSNKNTVKN